MKFNRVVSIDEQLRKLERPDASEEEAQRHHELTQQLIHKVGSVTEATEPFGRAETQKRYDRRLSETPINYSRAARNRSIRYDYTYRGMSVQELSEKYGLKKDAIYKALGNIEEVKRRRAKFIVKSRKT